MIDFDATREKRRHMLAQKLYKDVGDITRSIIMESAVMIRPENTVHTIRIDDVESRLFDYGESSSDNCKRFIIDVLLGYNHTSEPCVGFTSITLCNGNYKEIDFITVNLNPYHEYYVEIDFYDIYRQLIDMDSKIQKFTQDIIKSSWGRGYQYPYGIQLAKSLYIDTNGILNNAAKKAYTNNRIESLWMYLNDIGYNLILDINKNLNGGIIVKCIICTSPTSKFIWYLILRVITIFKHVTIMGYSFKSLK